MLSRSKGSQLKRTPFKSKPKPLKRGGPLRAESISETAEIKRQIQAVARQIVIARDGGCILRGIRGCNGLPGRAILQADHLITRENSATYADTRLIVCACRSCHSWKSSGIEEDKAEYDALVKSILPADRVALWEEAERDSWRPTRMYLADWKGLLVGLKSELARYCDEPIIAPGW